MDIDNYPTLPFNPLRHSPIQMHGTSPTQTSFRTGKKYDKRSDEMMRMRHGVPTAPAATTALSHPTETTASDPIQP
ncbi:hypothetical protein V496_06699 [Pseudogymnoascus sp. VKM F-4515 (FW-2607)]|nr:hypothetical protein V496_06699 [Pseudogymnoascus sp. VKM F-4515 (FW-2607)]